MIRVYRALAVMLVCIAVTAGLTFTFVNPVAAQSTDPKFSFYVPEFTIRFVNNSHYNLPPYTPIDPYTGQPTTITPGSFVKEESIEVAINNDIFKLYLTGGNYTSNVWFNIRYKGHYESVWKYFDPALMNNSASGTYVKTFYNNVPIGEVDFQVQAINKYQSSQELASGWSNIKTIKLPDGSVTVTFYPNLEPATTQPPEPTVTPRIAVPEFTVQYVDGNAVIKIKNQPLTSLYYIYGVKPHNSDKWQGNGMVIAEHDDGTLVYGIDNVVPQASSEYTTITLPVSNAQTDFRVKALEGSIHEHYLNNILPGPHYPAITGLDSSDWSATKTLTVNKIPAQTNPPFSQAPTQKYPADWPTTPTPTDEAITEALQTFTPYTLPIAIVTAVTIFGACYFVYDSRKHKNL